MWLSEHVFHRSFIHLVVMLMEVDKPDFLMWFDNLQGQFGSDKFGCFPKTLWLSSSNHMTSLISHTFQMPLNLWGWFLDTVRTVCFWRWLFGTRCCLAVNSLSFSVDSKWNVLGIIMTHDSFFLPRPGYSC